MRLAARVASPLGDRLLDAAGEATDPGVVATMVAAQLRAAGADAILAEARSA